MFLHNDTLLLVDYIFNTFAWFWFKHLNRGWLLFFQILPKKRRLSSNVFGIFLHFFGSCSFSHQRNSTISLPKATEYQRWTLLTLNCFRGSLHDTGITFVPAQAGSLQFPLMHGSTFVYMIYTTTKYHAGTSHPVCIQPSYVVLEQEFHSGMKYVCKCKTSTHFGVKSVCRWTGMGSACKMITHHPCILSKWLYLQITEINEMTDHHGKHATKSQSSSRQWELSCVNTPLVQLATARWNKVAFFDLGEIYHMIVLVNNYYYHSKQIFLSFHWPRAQHVTCK